MRFKQGTTTALAVFLRTLGVFVALALTSLSVAGQTAQKPMPMPPKAGAPQSPEPQVAVKESPPVRIAFLQHEGPYWTMGPAFQVVREAMVNMNEDGPLFVRFHGDPRNVAAAELRSDVGFVVDGGAAPPAPLTMDRRPAEKVAYLLAPAPHGTTARFYGTLYDWARKNGYAAKGGPVEVYWERDQKGVVEIQLPVEPAKTKPEGPGQPPVTAGEPEAAAPLRPNGEEAPSPDRMGVDSFGTDPGGKSEEPAAASSTSHEGRDDGAGGNRAAERFDELFASREFDAIAVEVLPVREFDEATQAWVGQLAYRTLAIGRGLQQKFGEEGKPVHDLAEALLRRYRALLPPGADPLAVAGRASTQALDPARKELLRQADLLLGRIALGSVQPEAATQEVIQMLRDLARALTIE